MTFSGGSGGAGIMTLISPLVTRGRRLLKYLFIQGIGALMATACAASCSS